MTTQKRNTLICVIFAIILIVYCVWSVCYFFYVDTWKYEASYEEYEAEFNLVKNYIAEEFPNETDKYVATSYNKDHGYRIYDPDNKKYLEAPEEVILALETIDREAFPHKDSKLDVIRIYEDRISFCIENGYYALVYSPNEKPTWLKFYNKEEKAKVKKIKDGWYHVTIR